MEIYNNWYLISAECDWCEQIKDCRYMFDNDIPVLAICEDCDTAASSKVPNFTNNTLKENFMNTTESTTQNTTAKEATTMNTTETMPICETKGCSANGKFHMLVWALNFNAYACDMLPLAYQDGSWQEVEMDFCGTHKNVLHRGKAVTLKLAVAPVTTYNLNVPEQRDLFSVEVLGQEINTPKEHTMDDGTEFNNYVEDIMHMSMDELIEHAGGLREAGSEITSMHAMGGYDSDEEFHAELDPITEELVFIDKLIDQKQEEENAMSEAQYEKAVTDSLPDLTEQKEEVTMSTKRILCGKCKGHHSSPAEVAECYGVQRKTTKRPSKPIVKEHPNSTSQWFASKKEAINFLKGLGDVSKGMHPANNGNGVWVWWKKS